MSASLGDANLVLLAWILAGVISMFGVFTYSGLASLTEEGGGQFEYFRIIYGNFFAFLFGWACFTVIQSASIASIAYVFSESVNNLFPFGEPLSKWKDFSLFGYIYPFANSGVKIFTILTIILLTIINYIGVKRGGLLNDIFSVAKIAGILLLIVAGFLLQGNAHTDMQYHDVFSGHAENFNLMSAMFTAMLAAFWAYDGWINLSYIGGEVKNPKKNIPIAIIGGTAIVMFIYVLLNYVYLQVMPVPGFIEMQAEGNKIAAAEVARLLLPGIGFTLISVLIMICTFGATNASLMSSPRIYHQMAKRKLFFPQFGETHPRFHTPHKSLLYQMIWSCILVISGTFDQLTEMLIFASFIFYGSGAVGILIMKHKKRITAKVPGYPVIPVIFILFCAGLVINTIYSQPELSLTGLFFVVIGIPIYFFIKKRQLKEQEE